MTPVPDKTRTSFQFFLIVTNGHLPHFCPTFNVATLLSKRSIPERSGITELSPTEIEETEAIPRK